MTAKGYYVVGIDQRNLAQATTRRPNGPRAFTLRECSGNPPLI